MPDGSAVAVNAAGDAHALNAEAAALWPDPPRTSSEIQQSLQASGLSSNRAATAALQFIQSLEAAQLAWVEYV